MNDRGAGRALRQLAGLHGVQLGYRDVRGATVRASTESVLAMLRALGAPIDGIADAPDALRARRAEREERFQEPVVVAWDGRLPSITVRPRSTGRLRVGLVDEGDDEPGVWWSAHAKAPGEPVEVRLDRRLPIGYHRLVVEAGARRDEVLVIAAPRRAPAPPDRAWGVFAPVHAIRSADDWGVGGLRELEALRSWLGERKGTVLATLPMLAQFLDEPFEPGPYSPVSRLCWNELYLDVERIPELEGSPEARAALDDPGLRRELGEIHIADLVDHRRAMAAKRRVLEPLAETVLSSPPPAIHEFLDARPEIRDYARFRAEVERRGSSWRTWSPSERDGELPGKAEEDPSGRYHLFVQWAADRQLGALVRGFRDVGAGLLLDLPLGVHPAGFDAWRERDLFVRGASAGSPPDPFFTHGQDWGFGPLHPDRVRADGYRYPIACVRHLLRHASTLRIDHVMGLHRLYCIPEGFPPTDGVYIRYRPQEWYAFLSVEADRVGATLVGEDLGTVPAHVRTAMRRHRVLGSYVVQYEARPEPGAALPEPPPSSVASVNTHDMPPFASFWEGEDVSMRVELGLLDEENARVKAEERLVLRGAMASFLVDRGLLDPDLREDPRAVLDGCLAYLAASDAAIVLAKLDDLWLDRRPQNVPGTTVEHPNWRIRMRHTLEELRELGDVGRTLDRVAALRGRSPR